MSSDAKLLKLIQKDLMDNYSIEDIVLMLSNELAKNYIHPEKHVAQMPARKVTGIDVWFTRFAWEAHRNKSKLTQEKIAAVEGLLNQYRDHLLGKLDLGQITSIRDNFETIYEQDIRNIYEEEAVPVSVEQRRKLVVKKSRIQQGPVIQVGAMGSGRGQKRKKTATPKKKLSDNEIAEKINNKLITSEELSQTDAENIKNDILKQVLAENALLRKQVTELLAAQKNKNAVETEKNLEKVLQDNVKEIESTEIKATVSVEETVNSEKMLTFQVNEASTSIGTITKPDSKLGNLLVKIDHLFKVPFNWLKQLWHVIVNSFIQVALKKLVNIDVISRTVGKVNTFMVNNRYLVTSTTVGACVIILAYTVTPQSLVAVGTSLLKPVTTFAEAIILGHENMLDWLYHQVSMLTYFISSILIQTWICKIGISSLNKKFLGNDFIIERVKELCSTAVSYSSVNAYLLFYKKYVLYEIPALGHVLKMII